MKLIRKDELHTIIWSGGTSTEILIYPECSSYAEKQFKWRVSTATIEKEKTVFTKLPGYSRRTMVLKGNLRLAHQGHHTSNLPPFAQDAYEGEWYTTSEGMVTNLNLMTAPSISSLMKVEAFDVRYVSYSLPCLKEQNHETHLLLIALTSFEVRGTLNASLNNGDTLYFKNTDLTDIEELKLYTETNFIRFVYIEFIEEQ
ncbi:HutD family protein [Planomicrobium sp. CPCC 101079]|uniref:HutD family protein n=1 Tax=Planomicrobium sp. CPCC 101079 TaxID=2599618 RepID=UPI0011B64378|nr:HutD family protein [Planomicrobium sp. CPCC 101079]TWT14312.1 hypothetical protein FQV28_01550 [Planomicrobium sp. CPCC 101079]